MSRGAGRLCGALSGRLSGCLSGSLRGPLSGTLSIWLGLVVALLALTAAPETGEAQRWRRSRELMERQIFPGNSFTFCRIQYTSGAGGGWRRRGGSWATDYPEADENFSLRLSQLTTLQVNRTEDGRFRHVVVRLDEPELFHYPFAYMLEVGDMSLTPGEQEGLRQYLLRGGFLLVDDFWGDAAWDNWTYEIEQVLPPERYPMVDIPTDHELFSIVFQLDEFPQVPGVMQYRRWEATGETWESGWRDYGRYGSQARCKGIYDDDGRLMAVIMHNTDLGDGWEREGQNYGYFRNFSAPKAYPMGINIVVYAMTH